MDLFNHFTGPKFPSESELPYDLRYTANQCVLATSPLRLTTSNFIFQLNNCDNKLYVTSSVTRGWVCCLQLLLAFVSAVILRSESRRTHDLILLSQIRDSSNLEGQVSVFVSPRNVVARLLQPTLTDTQMSNLATKARMTNRDKVYFVRKYDNVSFLLAILSFNKITF
jgi:hypothetical protein